MCSERERGVAAETKLVMWAREKQKDPNITSGSSARPQASHITWTEASDCTLHYLIKSISHSQQHQTQPLPAHTDWLAGWVRASPLLCHCQEGKMKHHHHSVTTTSFRTKYTVTKQQTHLFEGFRENFIITQHRTQPSLARWQTTSRQLADSNSNSNTFTVTVTLLL